MQRPEQQIQKSILAFIRLQYPKAIAFFIPNGANLGARVGGIYKSLGLLSGVADICVLWNGGKCGFIEIKSANGRLSDTQKAFGLQCLKLGHNWATANSIEQAKAAFTAWGMA